MKRSSRKIKTPVSKNATVRKVMQANTSTGTRLELDVRQYLARAGFRGYRLNWSKAPSKPDIAFVNKKVAILVNGCFWHGCRRCIKTTPKTNKVFWSTKIDNNRRRDRRNSVKLRKLGWRIYRLWEHDVKRGDLKPVVEWLRGEMTKNITATS